MSVADGSSKKRAQKSRGPRRWGTAIHGILGGSMGLALLSQFQGGHNNLSQWYLKIDSVMSNRSSSNNNSNEPFQCRSVSVDPSSGAPPNITLVVHLSGELGNYLSKLARRGGIKSGRRSWRANRYTCTWWARTTSTRPIPESGSADATICSSVFPVSATLCGSGRRERTTPNSTKSNNFNGTNLRNPNCNFSPHPA